MDKDKLVRKNLAISSTLDEMVEEIRQKKGLKTFVSVIELAINELHGRTFKDYVVSRGVAKSPEERADQQIKIQEIKKKKERDALVAIVDKLEGRIVKNASGGEEVEYFTYWKSNRYLQKMPLSMMSEDLLTNQYQPSREAIEQLRADGKVKYRAGTWNE